ncbi:MAG: hypothetical protein EBU90_12920 [Proteobacteria bacterium]|nr:hypothetical protein [Pseudomonadota bacterium]NBP15868.1 hypothetical protein [bacterium]
MIPTEIKEESKEKVLVIVQTLKNHYSDLYQLLFISFPDIFTSKNLVENFSILYENRERIIEFLDSFSNTSEFYNKKINNILVESLTEYDTEVSIHQEDYNKFKKIYKNS